MQGPNPYAPPGHASPAVSSYTPPGRRFAPLGALTLFTMIASGLDVLTNFASDGIQLAFAGELANEDAFTPAVFVQLAGLLAMVCCAILSLVAMCLWIYRASSNVHALGRAGLEFTPGWSVGWLFIPLANVVKTPAVMQQIWRGSDPSRDDPYRWRSAPSTPLIALWWTAWVVAAVLGNVSGRIDAPETSATVGLVGDAFSALASGAWIVLVRRVTARQAVAAEAHHADMARSAQPVWR